MPVSLIGIGRMPVAPAFTRSSRSAGAASRRTPASPNRASATALTSASTNPATAGPTIPGLVVSPRNSTPINAGGTVSSKITAAVAAVTLPLSSADAYSMNAMIPAAASV